MWCAGKNEVVWHCTVACWGDTANLSEDMTYLRNTWYVAAWASELGANQLLARTVLDEPLVFFRDVDGKPVALIDRCPHRFAPLSQGKILGNSVQCPYHGLQFGVDGRCTHNPHGPIPAAAKLKTYPLLERFGAIWIWMGDATKADESALADLSVIAVFA